MAQADQYEQAAQTLEDAAEKSWKLGGERSPFERDAKEFRARAELFARGPADVKANRALLLMLLREVVRFPEMDWPEPDDRRIGVIMNNLRANDPQAKAFFTPRKVKVVVQTSVLEDGERASLADQLMGKLRALGFDASTTEGDETFVFPISLGEHVEGGGLLMPGMSSQEFKCQAMWTVKMGKGLIIDMSLRGAYYPDIPHSFQRENYPRLANILVPRLLKRWNEAFPP